jgi:acyl-CoA synthetase (AMP-forming)/AMP-acid ligase II
MNVGLLLEMAAGGMGDRVAFGRSKDGLTYAELLERAQQSATWLSRRPIEQFALAGAISPAFPIGLFGAAIAGLPFTALNYRLADDRLRSLAARLAPGVIVADADVVPRIEGIDGIELIDTDDFFDVTASIEASPLDPPDPEAPAVLIFTSGTTGEPKAAVLRHTHLFSYIIGSYEYMSADESESILTCVPPYHVAGVSGLLSAVYTGRRIVPLPVFHPEDWVDLARDEAITHAMVVPTMLHRILDVLEERNEQLPALRHLASGGGRLPVAVIDRAMSLLPRVNFVNAYGLTETASTIAVLGPEDHREAHTATDERVRRRLSSVGRPLPSVEVEIRDPDGATLPPGAQGEIYVRGPQVSGEYVGVGSRLDADGWFPTHDQGSLDEDGFLYVAGRLDDVIVRGAENISPGEVETVLTEHPAVADACVVGLPDDEWGERVVAAIVVTSAVDDAELVDWVRARLRSTRTPQRFARVPELPYNETGKLLRRVVREQLLESS